MSSIVKLSALVVSLMLAACAAKQPAPDAEAASAKPAKAEPAKRGDTRVVKSQNGKFDGEIIGTPAPKSKFAKLKIGMTMRDVNKLIGTPDDIGRHETGKRWIPFYFGNDVQRMLVLYKSEGCLSYTGGNQFGAGENELVRIEVDAKGACFQ
jgi:hypothetical protein